MSEVLKEYKFLTDVEVHRLKELDHEIESLERNFAIINKFVVNREEGWTLMEAKLKKEKMIALTALSKSKLLLAEMEVYIAERKLNDRCQKSFKNVWPKASKDDSHSTKSLPPSSRIPLRPSSTSSISKHSSGRGSLTASGVGSISPLNSSNRVSSITKSSSLKNRKGNFIRKTEDITPEGSFRSITTTPYSRNRRKYWSFTRESVVDNQKHSSTKQSTLTHESSVCNVKENIRKHETLDNSNSTHINTNVNRSLTDSNLADFNTSSNKDNLLGFGTNATKRKINPVANIYAYKKINLNNKLHETTPAPKIRPPLHPGDPRKYPTSDAKKDSITKTPMRLPVPQMKQSRPAPALLKPSEEIIQQPLYFPSQSKQVQVATVVATQSNSVRHMTSINSPNHIESTHFSFYGTPTMPRIVQEHIKTPQTEVVNSHNCFSHLSRNSQNILSHPPKVNSKKSQLAVVNTHICVPVPPMYSSSRNAGSLGRPNIPESNRTLSTGTPKATLNSSYAPRYVPRVKLSTKTKQLRTPDSPTKICFNNSF